MMVVTYYLQRLGSARCCSTYLAFYTLTYLGTMLVAGLAEIDSLLVRPSCISFLFLLHIILLATLLLHIPEYL